MELRHDAANNLPRYWPWPTSVSWLNVTNGASDGSRSLPWLPVYCELAARAEGYDINEAQQDVAIWMNCLRTGQKLLQADWILCRWDPWSECRMLFDFIEPLHDLRESGLMYKIVANKHLQNELGTPSLEMFEREELDAHGDKPGKQIVKFLEERLSGLPDSGQLANQIHVIEQLRTVYATEQPNCYIAFSFNGPVSLASKIGGMSFWRALTAGDDWAEDLLLQVADAVALLAGKFAEAGGQIAAIVEDFPLPLGKATIGDNHANDESNRLTETLSEWLTELYEPVTNTLNYYTLPRIYYIPENINIGALLEAVREPIAFAEVFTLFNGEQADGYSSRDHGRNGEQRVAPIPGVLLFADKVQKSEGKGSEEIASDRAVKVPTRDVLFWTTRGDIPTTFPLSEAGKLVP